MQISVGGATDSNPEVPTREQVHSKGISDASATAAGNLLPIVSESEEAAKDLPVPMCDEPSLDSLRTFLPRLGMELAMKSGKRSILWGVTMRGLIVNHCASNVLITVGIEEVVVEE